MTNREPNKTTETTMAKGKRSERERRISPVRTYLRPSEAKSLTERADAAGLTVSDYVRLTVLRALREGIGSCLE